MLDLPGAAAQDGDLLPVPRHARDIALGSGFPWAVEEEDVPRVNVSEVHVDFMIGSDEVDVTGVTRDGQEVPVLRGGAWQI